MAYTPFTWADGASGGTPITAARLNALENGLGAVASTYVPADPEMTLTYNGDGTVATETRDGIVTSFTYNGDGTVATSTRQGVTRTYTYSGGNLVGVA